MANQLKHGEYWLINWNPSKEPEHQEFFDHAAKILSKGQKPELIRWRCIINTQLAGDPFIFKRGASSKHAGIFAFGVIAEDREDFDSIDLQLEFIAPQGQEYPLKKLRELDPNLLKLFASGHSISAKTVNIIIHELKAFSPPQPKIAIHYEGQIRETLQSQRERSSQARKECLEHFGDQVCQCCKVNFVELFGEMGRILHCHHREDLAIKGEGEIDGKRDLVPVCPNCHAMLHYEKPAMPVSKLSKIIKNIR